MPRETPGESLGVFYRLPPIYLSDRPKNLSLTLLESLVSIGDFQGPGPLPKGLLRRTNRMTARSNPPEQASSIGK
jgi:hypothetical protein